MIKKGLLLIVFAASMMLASDHDCKIDTTNTLSKMLPVDEESEDCGFMQGLASSLPSAVEPLSDFYWSSNCSNSFEGIMEYTRERSWPMKEIELLTSLKEKSPVTYNAVINAHRAMSCSDDKAFQNFISDFSTGAQK